jgi:hypothetical protein
MKINTFKKLNWEKYKPCVVIFYVRDGTRIYFVTDSVTKRKEG